ncbi:galactolipase DONGLE [Cucumis melo var. makuwa]|uniref:Galactolipase DONGLE n=3 Tax=Cucumis melo TaxID=3656 RepID=A0A5A7VKE2_CUCMM|nr:galactolipase DONGLE, chloroplastic-like [Cucumis melo]KAA0067660.1 galactolipase DONGLE [Cucumis melo var. makuwa]TYK23664.1 galactolipase DONGLE [Cucumis melo var. makuwa]
MAATTLKLNSIPNHVTFFETTRPMSHSFGQVSIPRKSDINVSSSSSSSSYSSSASRRLSVSSSSVLVPLMDVFSSSSSSFSSCSTAAAAAMVQKVASLARLWRQIHGCNDWEDLVEPTLHPLLRREIIRYGEFVTACYKAFDLDPNSKRYLTCKFGKKSLLKEVGLESSGYEVTKYIYATPPDINIPPIQNSPPSCGRWIGYVAVSSDETSKRLGRRDIIITFRGTVTHPEWIANLMSSLTPARLDPHNHRPDVKVESGFLTLYTSEESNMKFGLESCREQLLSEVSRILNKYKEEEVSITMAGHSMGSALALLLAYDIAELGLNRRTNNEVVPVSVFSFGGPRVGNSGFKKRCDELGVKVLRIVNVNDPITKMPGVLFNENFRAFGGLLNGGANNSYEHVGVELVLDFFNMQNPSCVHDLETYISLLRCPKQQEDRGQDEDNHGDHNGRRKITINSGEFINKAKEFLCSNAQSLNMFPWRNPMNYLSQSQN